MSSSFEAIRLAVKGMPGRRCDHCGRIAAVYAFRVNDRRFPVRYCRQHAESIIGPAALVSAGAELPGQLDLGLEEP